jgi:hypothetical protein
MAWCLLNCPGITFFMCLESTQLQWQTKWNQDFEMLLAGLLPCHIQSAWMRGIQNKIIISQKAFIIYIYRLHHYKGKLSKFSCEYINFSANFNVDPLVARQISKRYSTSFHIAWSMFGVTVATASLMQVFRYWRPLIFPFRWHKLDMSTTN